MTRDEFLRKKRGIQAFIAEGSHVPTVRIIELLEYALTVEKHSATIVSHLQSIEGLTNVYGISPEEAVKFLFMYEAVYFEEEIDRCRVQ